MVRKGMTGELAWYEVGGKKYYFDELVKENIPANDLVSNNQNLDTILQEADKDFEDFYWETGKYNGRDLGIDGYKDFIHSNITKAYEAGCDNGKEIYKKAHKLAMERGKQQTIKKI